MCTVARFPHVMVISNRPFSHALNTPDLIERMNTPRGFYGLSHCRHAIRFFQERIGRNEPTMSAAIYLD